jgi:PAS domain S-box-containing protein
VIDQADKSRNTTNGGLIVTLRLKIFLVTGAMTLGLVACIYFASRSIVLNVFSQLEEQSIRQDAKLVLSVIDGYLGRLNDIDTDSATWNQALASVSNPAAVASQGGLKEETFVNLELNVVIALRADGEVIFAQGYNLDSKAYAPVPQDLLTQLHAYSQGLSVQERDGMHGIILTSQGPLLIVAHNILHSWPGDVQPGTLLVGRYLDAKMMRQIESVTGLQADVHALDQLPAPVYRDAVQQLRTGAEVVTRPEGESMVAGYILLDDIRNTPALVLRILDFRSIYLQGQDMLRYFLGVIGAAILIFGVAMEILLECTVLRRINRLSARVVSIGDQGDFTARVEQKSNDELGRLAGAINKMLMALDEAHQALTRSAKYYRSLIANSMDGILVIDRQQVIHCESPIASHILGCAGNDFPVHEYAHLIHLEDRLLFRAIFKRSEQMPGVPLSGAARIRSGEGEYRYVEGSITNWLDDPSINGMVMNFRDITERKQAELQVQRQLEILTALYAGAQKLAQSLDSLDLAKDVARTCVETFGLRLAWVGRAEPDGRVSVLAQYPTDCDYPRQITVRWDDSPQGQGPTGQAIHTQTPVVIDDLLANPHTSPWRTPMQQYGLRTGAALPLVSRQHGFGALLLYGDQPGQFTPERVAFFQSYASLAAASLENARLIEQTTHRLQHVQALHKIDAAMTSSLDLSATLDVILEQTTAQLGVDAAAVLLYDPQARELIHTAGRGFRTTHVQQARVSLDKRYAGRAAREQRTIVSDWWQRTDAEYYDPVYEKIISEEGFKAHVSAPLVTKGQIVGVLEVFHRSALDTNTEWLELLETLAGQAAISIDSATVFDNLQRSHAELEKAYNSTLEGWSRALDLRDKETEGHSQRVMEMTAHLAQAFGLDATQITNLRRGALLHDIGKIGVPDHILLKPGKLTAEEWVIMRKHPQYAYDMISPIAYLQPVIDIPYCHHEKWDGSGYPRGLKGEEIPLAARIFAVVDVWDALTSDRPYRPAWPPDRVREYIRSQSGTHFDPRVVQAFFEFDVGRVGAPRTGAQ